MRTLRERQRGGEKNGTNKIREIRALPCSCASISHPSVLDMFSCSATAFMNRFPGTLRDETSRMREWERGGGKVQGREGWSGVGWGGEDPHTNAVNATH